jgi:hypothetical protein
VALRLPKKNAFFGAVDSDFSFREDEPEPPCLEEPPAAELPPLPAALAMELEGAAPTSAAASAAITVKAATLEAITATLRRASPRRFRILIQFT